MKDNKEEMMYKLHKAMYGLKQTPMAWNMKIDSFFKHLRFKICEMELVLLIFKIQCELKDGVECKHSN